KTKAAAIAIDCITNMTQFRHRSSMLLPSTFLRKQGCRPRPPCSARESPATTPAQQFRRYDRCGLRRVSDGPGTSSWFRPIHEPQGTEYANATDSGMRFPDKPRCSYLCRKVHREPRSFD